MKALTTLFAYKVLTDTNMKKTLMYRSCKFTRVYPSINLTEAIYVERGL